MRSEAEAFLVQHYGITEQHLDSTIYSNTKFCLGPNSENDRE